MEVTATKGQIIKGKPVATSFTLPIRFQIE